MVDADEVQPRPYRMDNQIQTYAWGTRNADAFIPRLLGVPVERDVPYAELWLGAHPKAPSQVKLPGGRTASLEAWIAAHPVATLGHVVLEAFGSLPFLLKVLSAGEALSIQAHPTKAQAEELHTNDPTHYPDANHKPEIAIALDGLTALMGIKPYPDLATILARYPEIADFIGETTVTRAALAKPESVEDPAPQARELFAALISRANADPGALATAVDGLAERLSAQSTDLGEDEELFLELRFRYGSDDVGLFALFFLNLIHLAPGEGLFTDAGVPHAYLRGNIIECMANSDNVVRVGLTPKFKDAGTLLSIVDTTPQRPAILTGSPASRACTVYKTPAEEFEIRRWSLPPDAEQTVRRDDTPAILLVIKGQIDLTWDSGKMTLERGDSVFLPACLRAYAMHTQDGAMLFEATVGKTG
jgi:mannose-6-phosphate isomerase